jgi:hypothetical protein
MATFNPNNVKIGPGTLYAAPLGSVEPTSVTGAWGAGWSALGYTEQGSEFDFGPTTAAVSVEEELWPIREVITGYAGKLTFALAEITRANLALVLNAGFGSSVVSASQGANSDGSLWQEPPAPGGEQRVMLGWDAQYDGAASGSDPVGRLIIRQALQTGTIKAIRRKGNNKTTYSAEFTLEKPAGVQPFRIITEASLAS